MSKLIVYGRHSAKSVMTNPQRHIEQILSTKNTVGLIPESLKHKVSLLDKIAIEKYLEKNAIYNALHQDIVVITQLLSQPDLYQIIGDAHFIVLLDELQDGQNIGAIMRSALLFNVDAIISTSHNSPNENAHILKSACGAFEYMPFIRVTNLSQTMQILKENNFWLIGMSCNAIEDLSNITKKFNANEKIALIVGNEESGMRRSTEKNCDFLIKIPVNQQYGVDSLNASNAAAIFLYEVNKIFLTNV